MTTRSRGRCSGNGLRDGRLRSKRSDRPRTRCRHLRCQFVLGCGGLQVFELQFHLFEKPGLALRAAAVDVAPQLLDLQPRARRASAHRKAARALTASASARRGNGLGFHDARGALGEDHRVGAGKVGRGADSAAVRSWRRWNHIRPRRASAFPHPTDVGRQVFCGIRQSIPRQQIAELRGRDHYRPVGRRWPDKTAALQLLR